MATKKITPENSRFTFNIRPTISAVSSDAKALRKFGGVAYTGEVIEDHYWWGNVIFDLSTMSVPPKLPALIDHDSSQRAGYVTSHTVDDLAGFSVEGNLLSNEAGSSVAKDSDEGFPWQMSVYIDPSSIEEVMAGVAMNVNGRAVDGPATIFRNSSISEISFTAVGWDSKTSAAAMSRSGTTSTPTDNGDISMTEAEKTQLEALQAANAKLLAEKDAAVATATAFSKAKRTADIQLLFAETGRTYAADDADAAELAAMEDNAFSSVAKFSRAQYKKQPATLEPSTAHLFAHTATGGSQAAPNASTAQRIGTGLIANAKVRAAAFAR